MTSKKQFKVNDKVFAKVRGFPAWPALVTGVKNADIPSKTKYNVFFYGTSERAECKPDHLYSYEENKSTLGKPNNRKYFAEALTEIEDNFKTVDCPSSITTSNGSTVKLETPSDVFKRVDKKSDTNLDLINNRESASKGYLKFKTERFSNTSNNSGPKIKPKNDFNYAEASENSRMSSKIPEKKYSITANDQSTKVMSKNESTASPPLVIGPTKIIVNINQTIDNIKEDPKLPVELKDVILKSMLNVKSERKRNAQKKLSECDLLQIENKMLDCIMCLRRSLKIDHPSYEIAIDALDRLSELQINALMLKKNREVVDTVIKVTNYVVEPEERVLNKQEMKELREKTDLIRHMALTVYNKFKSLFTVPKGKSFQEIFSKEINDFYTKTQHLTRYQICGMTSDKLINNL